MLGFVYAGTSLITLAYVWFCVGETANRTNAELDYFFHHGVPVRQWRTYQFEGLDSAPKRTMSDAGQISEVEKQRIVAHAHAIETEKV
jgi:hypothetical protein